MAYVPPVAPTVGWSHHLRLGRDYYLRLDSNDYSVDPAAIGRQSADKARASGVRVALKVWPVVHHGWQLVWRLPESRESLALACRFLQDAAAGMAVAPRPASAAPPADAQPLAPFPDPSARPAGHADVILIGAGLSGVGTAVHLQQRCPDKRVLLLDADNDVIARQPAAFTPPQPAQAEDRAYIIFTSGSTASLIGARRGGNFSTTRLSFLSSVLKSCSS